MNKKERLEQIKEELKLWLEALIDLLYPLDHKDSDEEDEEKKD